MKKENKKLIVEIIGREEHLQTIANFLRIAEYLGNIGSTRTLSLWIDGDGAARIKVNFIDTEKPEISKETIKKIENEDIFKMYLD